MSITSLLLLALCLALVSFVMGRQKAYSVAKAHGGPKSLHSLPGHYGLMVGLWCALPALAIIIGWKLFEGPIVSSLLDASIPQAIHSEGEKAVELYKNEINNLANSGQIDQEADAAKVGAATHLNSLRSYSSIALLIFTLAIAVIGAALAYRKIKTDTQARPIVERIVHFFLVASASIAILTTVGILFSVLFEATRFFQQVSIVEFVTGTKWSPQTAIRADQAGSSGSFGAIPLFLGTLLISVIAMIVAVPFGLMSAIYLLMMLLPLYHKLCEMVHQGLALPNQKQLEKWFSQQRFQGLLAAFYSQPPERSVKP